VFEINYKLNTNSTGIKRTEIMSLKSSSSCSDISIDEIRSRDETGKRDRRQL